MPYSIVLLLREPHFFTEAELQASVPVRTAFCALYVKVRSRAAVGA